MSDIDLKPTEQMAANAARGLELREKHGRGGTAVGVARARDLKNRVNLSPETVRRMHSYFARHEVDKKGEGWGKDSAGYIAWLLWGGDAGKSWAARKVEQLDRKEENGMSRIGKEIAHRLGVFARPATKDAMGFVGSAAQSGAMAARGMRDGAAAYRAGKPAVLNRLDSQYRGWSDKDLDVYGNFWMRGWTGEQVKDMKSRDPKKGVDLPGSRFSRPGTKAGNSAESGSFQVGDKVNVVVDGHIEAYGRIVRITGGKAIVASAEGNVPASLSDLKLVQRGTQQDLKSAGFKARRHGLVSLFYAQPGDIGYLLKEARKMHDKGKRIAEKDAKSPDAHTQGGVAGMASSMMGHFDRVLKNHLERLTKHRDPDVRKEAKSAYAEIKGMEDWWYAMYKKITASRPGAKVAFGFKTPQEEMEWIANEIGETYEAIDGADDDDYDKGMRYIASLEKRMKALEGKSKASRPGAKAKMAKPAVDREAMQARYREAVEYLNRAVQSLRIAEQSGRSSDIRELTKDVQHYRKERDNAAAELKRYGMMSRPGAKSRNAIREGEKISAGEGDAVSRKISKLVREGYPQDQAVAIALDMKRRGEL